MNIPDLIDMAAALAVTALLAESYGAVRRRLVGNELAPLVIGISFGIMSTLQMHLPLEPFEGLIIDMRNIPIALAGAFLGWRGLIPCLLIAAAVRIGIGGVGAIAGLWGMVISGLAGMIWARKMAEFPKRNFGMLLLLGLAMSSHLLGALALPRDLAVWFYTSAAGPILVMNLITVPLIGALLERENRRVAIEMRRKLKSSRDPDTGLLTGHAMVREVTNAFAAHPLGTFAGMLVIAPQASGWRGLFPRGSTDLSSEVDARFFSDQLTHWVLAGRTTSGKIVVPLTQYELETAHRLKHSIRSLLADSSIDGQTPLYWDISEVEALDPSDFLKLTERAALATQPDWTRHGPTWRSAIVGPRKKSQVRRSKIFNPDKHDALFAKASFLMERGRS